MTLESLLSETDWLRTLARQLVRDEDHAQDLFQETLLASLRDHETVRGPARPWLSRVAKNLASKRRRSEARRARREQAAATPEADGDTLDTAEKFAMHRVVVEAVETLDEPYRETVLLRFWEDLPPREIAKQMSVPVETAKTRLKRGMQMLRGQLDRHFGDRATWVTAMVPTFGLNPQAAVAGGAALALFLNAKTILSTAALGLVSLLAYTAIEWPAEVPKPSNTTTAASAPRDNELPSPSTNAANIVASANGMETRNLLEEAPAGPELTVRLITKSTGAAAGARTIRYIHEVDMRSPQAMAESERVSTGELAVVDFLRARSTPLQSDAQGRVRIPIPKKGALLAFVVDGNTEGKLQLRGDLKPDSEHVLHLYPKITIPVEVVDANGKPRSGVPVCWHSRSRRRFHRQTSAKGRANLWLAFAFEEVQARRGKVLVDAPFECEKAVDLDHLPSEPIRLTLPETGSLEVTILNGKGRPIDGQGYVSLYPSTTDNAPKASTPLSGIAAARQRMLAARRQARAQMTGQGRLGRAKLRSGKAFFPMVGLGQRFEIRASLPHLPEAIRGRGTGPRTAGTHSRITIRHGNAERIVKIPIRNAGGEPLANAMFQGTLLTRHERSSRSSHRQVFRTDATGDLRVLLKEAFADGTKRTLTIREYRSGQTNDGASKLVDLSRSFPFGTTTLAPVRLAPTPILVAGRVVDGAGKPIPGAELSLSYQDGITGRGQPFYRFVPDVERQRSRADGSFELRGYFPKPTLRVLATKDGRFQPDFIDVATGSRDVSVPLLRRGSIHGSFAGSLALDHVMVRATPRRVVRGIRSYSGSVDASRNLRFDLPPGLYDVRIHIGHSESPLLEIPVAVEPGKQHRPQALQAIELAARLKTIAITLLDPDRKPVVDEEVCHYVGSTGTGFTTDAKGVARIMTAKNSIEIVVDLDGYRPVYRSSISKDTTIVLEPRIAVTFRVRGKQRPGVELSVLLSRTGPDPNARGAFVTETAQVDAAGLARLQMPRPGKYRLRASFRMPGKNAVFSGWYAPKTSAFVEREIEIDASGRTPIRTITIDGERQAQAIAEFQAWLAKMPAARKGAAGRRGR